MDVSTSFCSCTHLHLSTRLYSVPYCYHLPFWHPPSDVPAPLAVFSEYLLRRAKSSVLANDQACQDLDHRDVKRRQDKSRQDPPRQGPSFAGEAGQDQRVCHSLALHCIAVTAVAAVTHCRLIKPRSRTKSKSNARRFQTNEESTGQAFFSARGLSLSCCLPLPLPLPLPCTRPHTLPAFTVVTPPHTHLQCTLPSPLTTRHHLDTPAFNSTQLITTSAPHLVLDLTSIHPSIYLSPSTLLAPSLPRAASDSPSDHDSL